MNGAQKLFNQIEISMRKIDARVACMFYYIIFFLIFRRTMPADVNDADVRENER